MVLGMSLATFTQLHVVLSLIGIGAGFVVVYGLWTAQRLPRWTALFLATTVTTSVTGFLFPSTIFGPAHIVGVISLVVLAVTLPALYAYRLAGAWRWIYVAGAVIALYLNVFVGVVQAFAKLAPLHALAPTGTEPAFQVAQLLTLAIFVGVCVIAVRRFRPAAGAV